MKTQIKRRCSCGCRQVTYPGNRYVNGHNRHQVKHSKESRRKISLAAMYNINGEGNKGKKRSKEIKLKMSLAMLKCNPNRKYCDGWYDKEYKDDLRKDHCENADCTKINKWLVNHHINLNKKDCRPSNVMTLCNSCHRTLHNRLGLNANYKDYLTINRLDRITYIHKKTRQVLSTIIRIQE